MRSGEGTRWHGQVVIEGTTELCDWKVGGGGQRRQAKRGADGQTQGASRTMAWRARRRLRGQASAWGARNEEKACHMSSCARLRLTLPIAASIMCPPPPQPLPLPLHPLTSPTLPLTSPTPPPALTPEPCCHRGTNLMFKHTASTPAPCRCQSLLQPSPYNTTQPAYTHPPSPLHPPPATLRTSNPLTHY